MRKAPHETALSKQAAPPTRKPAALWGAAGALFAIIAILSLSRSTLFATVAFTGVAVATGFGARAMTYNGLVFPRLREQWERSCMCDRCGSVFRA